MGPAWLGQGWYRTGSPISVSGQEYVAVVPPAESKLEVSSDIVTVSIGQPSAWSGLRECGIIQHLTRCMSRHIHRATVCMWRCKSRGHCVGVIYTSKSMVSFYNAPYLTICDGQTVTPGTALENCVDRILAILGEVAVETTVTRRDVVLWSVTDTLSLHASI